MKIYTKTGDLGETSFFGGMRVKKNDPRIEAYGILDELNSTLGMAVAFSDDPHITKIVQRIQNDLFTASAELASLTFTGTKQMPKINSKLVEEVEGWIDEAEGKLPPQTSFIIPGGTKASSFLHFARTTIRKCERAIIGLSEQMVINPELIKYVNRLSDLFHVLARLANKELAKEQQPIYHYFGK